jgi:hypothetical protein
MAPTPLLDHPDLAAVPVPEVHDAYEAWHVADWSDRRLAGAVAEVVAVPKEAPADSFVLHAPLELLARVGLLRAVRPEARDGARRRLVWLAASYGAAGPSVEEPLPVDGRSPDELAGDLVAALAAGDLDDVDRLASALGRRSAPDDLRRLLAEPVAASLAAAAHGSILLHLLSRVAPQGEVTGAVLRGPARELARMPQWRLRWFEDPDEPIAGTPLADALLDVPALGLPGSDFIHPIMNQAEESGLAARLLTGALAAEPDPVTARRELARVAALSMLEEPPDYAPYGWSHCLTMPQAVLGLAGRGASRRTAVAVAATHVVGFRAALGTRSLDGRYEPPPPATSDLREAIADGPDEAAATAYHAPEEALSGVVTELATRASLHHDAHLVKYTLACLDAAADDPDRRRLHLASAASLSAWWAAQPSDGFLGAS